MKALTLSACVLLLSGCASYPDSGYYDPRYYPGAYPGVAGPYPYYSEPPVYGYGSSMGFGVFPSYPQVIAVPVPRGGHGPHGPRDRNADGIADWKQRDRNTDGVPDWKQRDRNRDGVPDFQQGPRALAPGTATPGPRAGGGGGPRGGDRTGPRPSRRGGGGPEPGIGGS